MPDVSVSALTHRQQKLVENARIALELGNLDYVIDACAQVLKAEVGCVAVRRLHRKAQLRQFLEKNRARAQDGLSATPFIFSSAAKNPVRAMENAEKILALDPTSISALKFMAEAALGLQLPETAAFALEAVHEIDREDRGNLLALGEAWLAAGRPDDALRVADELLQARPADADGQNLMRKATIARNTAREAAAAPGSPGETVAGGPAPASPVIADPAPTPQQVLARALGQIKQEPGHLEHYRVIVVAYRQLGELQEALSWVRKARQLPAGAADMTLEKQESELEAALLEVNVRLAESAVMAAPRDFEALERVAAARSELASFRLFEAKRYSDRYPNDLAARHALGHIFLESGQFDAAIAQFQQALNHPPVRVAALTGLGRAYKQKKVYEQAVVQLTIAKVELAAMDDRKKEVIYELGEAYEGMGKADLAIAEFKAIYSEDIVYRDVAAKIDAYYSARQ